MPAEQDYYFGKAATYAPISGGKPKTKKATAAKKATKPKPKPAAAKPKTRTTRGGSFFDDVKALSVPFSLILAKQGLDSMKARPSSSASKRSAAATQRGGSCGTQCAGGMYGGSSSKVRIPHTAPSKKTMGGSATGPVGAQMAQLSKKIDNFLSKY